MNFYPFPEPGWEEKLDRMECPRCDKPVRVISQDANWIALLCEACKGGFVMLKPAGEALLAADKEKAH